MILAINGVFLLLARYVTSDTWNQMNVQCLLKDAAIDNFDALTETHCCTMASSKRDVGTLVVQFDQKTLKCTMYLFQSVCRQMVAGQSPDCRVFVRSVIDIRSINPKLSNVWVGDLMSRFDNLVCQSDADMNRFYAVGGVQWSSSYGAQFDGQSGYLVMRKGNMDFLGGLTWLLRLKRTPKVQPYLDFVDCSNLSAIYYPNLCWWEHSIPRMMAAGTPHLKTFQSFIYLTQVFLPSDSEQWIDVGITLVPNSGLYNIYYNGYFLANSTVTKSTGPEGYVFPTICSYFGWRYGDNTTRFTGTLRAIGLANASMSEGEMRDFFNLVD